MTRNAKEQQKVTHGKKVTKQMEKLDTLRPKTDKELELENREKCNTYLRKLTYAENSLDATIMAKAIAIVHLAETQQEIKAGFNEYGVILYVKGKTAKQDIFMFDTTPVVYELVKGGTLLVDNIRVKPNKIKVIENLKRITFKEAKQMRGMQYLSTKNEKYCGKGYDNYLHKVEQPKKLPYEFYCEYLQEQERYKLPLTDAKQNQLNKLIRSVDATQVILTDAYKQIFLEGTRKILVALNQETSTFYYIYSDNPTNVIRDKIDVLREESTQREFGFIKYGENLVVKQIDGKFIILDKQFKRLL